MLGSAQESDSDHMQRHEEQRLQPVKLRQRELFSRLRALLCKFSPEALKCLLSQLPNQEFEIRMVMELRISVAKSSSLVVLSPMNRPG